MRHACAAVLGLADAGRPSAGSTASSAPTPSAPARSIAGEAVDRSGAGGTAGHTSASVGPAPAGEGGRASVAGARAAAGASENAGASGSAGAAGSTAVHQHSAGCGKTATRLDAKTQQMLRVSGKDRYYLVYVPTDYDPQTPLPVVFALHGKDMNDYWAANANDGFKLIEASKNKALLVYPQGSGDVPKNQRQWGDITSSWNPGASGGDAMFLDALLEHIENTYCVDTSRRFFIGFSMGGWMTETFACDHAKVFRAFAPVAGWGPGGFETGHGSKPSCGDANVAVPILITQGSADDIVTPDNGQNSRDFWLGRNGCTTGTTMLPAVGCVSYQGCRPGLPVQYCSHGGGHVVPSTTGANAWAFFSSL